MRPTPLQKGDSVGIIALACKVDFEAIQPTIKLMENTWGLKVFIGESVMSEYHQFGGTDEVRANDFQLMLNNPEIKAIFSARGGYGSSRLLDSINFTDFQKSPKWVVGFSDITAVLSHIHTLNIESLHATMPKLFLQEGGEKSLESLKKILFGEMLDYQVNSQEMNRLGFAKGQLIGGNLAILSHIFGSKSDINYDGKILFLEDVNEYLYSIDRMMIQLKRAGKLKNLAGLIIGHFSDCQDNNVPFGKTANEIIQEAVAEYNFPVCYGFPVGHEPENWAMPVGREVILEVKTDGVFLREATEVVS
ncbi:LD-carboxypeptidase [Arcicella sp. LKC2W]|uniref:S66 peptidase family protein n=1 Tax=Arcicella sp. LKC2W TaxID=2984198 RepID=UPI002B205AA3|nr:LD-carboxypeptidase [Arcicella sp. LKC2W]MEA5459692.1 LD-carboxypeptidase [Arcicella sp. LKC2W]